MWYGFDPGSSFGVARLADTGEYEASQAASFDERNRFVGADAQGLGVDSVLWWSKKLGGGRKADDLVRRACRNGGGNGGTVSPINSLQGSMFVPAYLQISSLRLKYPSLPITEAHPKALLHAMRLPVWRPSHRAGLFEEGWSQIAERFDLKGRLPRSEHERDAIIAAVSAREGFTGRWPIDLSQTFYQEEVFLDDLLLGPVHYFWPSSAGIEPADI